MQFSSIAVRALLLSVAILSFGGEKIGRGKFRDRFQSTHLKEESNRHLPLLTLLDGLSDLNFSNLFTI
jgi:hypothetical protein